MWLGTFRGADDSNFPQAVKPFVLPCSSPFPLLLSILVPISACLSLLVQLCFFLSLASFCLIFSLPYLSYHSCCILPLFLPVPIDPWCLSGLTQWPVFFFYFFSLLFPKTSVTPSALFDFDSFFLQAMWMRVKARWWATCFISWAMSTSVPCTSMSRNQKRQERPRLPMLGSWMRLARKGTGINPPVHIKEKSVFLFRTRA